MRRLLVTLETTCDETAAAVIDDRRREIASAVASQEQVHQRFHGVVPELAARAHLERIVPIVSQVLEAARVVPDEELVAVAVATEPGLPGSLLVGLAAAKALCVAWKKPLVSINHIHAHVYACQLGRVESIFPCLGLVISGGHTHWYRCQSADDWQLLGGTIDDAAGEAFDKVAVMLGLAYPGGAHIARLARSGNPRAYALPRPLVNDQKTLNFSFSGLKTAVRYHLVAAGKQDFSALQLSDYQRADMAASFQQALIDCVLAKAELALVQTGLQRLCVGGGVAANQQLRRELQHLSQRRGVELIIAPAELCTDNAVMGAIAWEKIERGQFSSLDIDIQPGLLRRA
ncbi:MAG: tRNA (adenosine(37)-N6)-threonylcarbamoyltransferase complex transferase subunit TsaD [Pirellulaceae bacterium]|nr:tRNA (adenosine(37)-N6)-threonylcarbamoyltransferase complex transferase subunit TsaD [Pirellulaceae bacterium]